LREERELMLILEDEHAHKTSHHHSSQFEVLASRLSMSETVDTLGN
jgi:hypothetical protein